MRVRTLFAGLVLAMLLAARSSRPSCRGGGSFTWLAAARRERLLDVQADWPPDERQRVADILQRLARELVPPRAA